MSLGTQVQALKERRRVAIQNAEKRWQEDNNINTPAATDENTVTENGVGVALGGFDALSHYSEVMGALIEMIQNV